MLGLERKVVVVTGGASGIGRSYVESFLKYGAWVAIADIDLPAAESLAADLSGEGNAVMAGRVDVSCLDDVRNFFEQVWQKWQRLDVLVNNAAMYSSLERKSFLGISEKEWDQVLSVNLKGMFFCCQAAFPYLKQAHGGRIINISSSSIFKGSPYFVHYVTSKAGVVGFTRALAREAGEYGITVNAVAPGLTVTDANVENTPPDRFNKAILSRCIKREQLPEDLTGIVLFLASGHSDFITGQLINVDGGNSMY